VDEHAGDVTSAPISLPIERDRILRYVETLGECGACAAGGVFRPVYSKAWADAKAQIARWMRDAGLDVREDAVGNLFGRLAGRTGGAVLTGSHIDTVDHGGKYDGVLGCIAGLVAVHALSQAFGPPRTSIEVVVTCEEEGSRFPCRMWGSRAISGSIAPDETTELVDADGISIGQAMRDAGYDPAAIGTAVRHDIDAFLELHIEQGGILDSARVPVGIVTAITGITQLLVRVAGRADHAGTTPMDLRRDALLGFADMVLGIHTAVSREGRPAVATVGRVEVAPGAPNIVPDRVEFTVDIRHPDPAVRTAMTRAVESVCREAGERRGLGVEHRVFAEIPEAPLDQKLVRLLEEAARRQGIPYRLMVSGAGHDAQVLSRRFPAGMIFVPSREGRSHSPAEFTAIEDIVPGVAVLAAGLHRLAY
jgi:allantoate deiminase